MRLKKVGEYTEPLEQEPLAGRIDVDHATRMWQIVRNVSLHVHLHCVIHAVRIPVFPTARTLLDRRFSAYLKLGLVPQQASDVIVTKPKEVLVDMCIESNLGLVVYGIVIRRCWTAVVHHHHASADRPTSSHAGVHASHVHRNDTPRVCGVARTRVYVLRICLLCSRLKVGMAECADRDNAI